MSFNKIICATKGSKESQIAEDKAIEIAKENNADLIFLHIIDIELLEKGGDVSEGDIEDLESGMKHVGEVILEAAIDKATEKGIAREKISKEEATGKFMEIMKAQVEKHNADLVIVGHSMANEGLMGRLLFSKEKPGAFEKKIREELKCEIRII